MHTYIHEVILRGVKVDCLANKLLPGNTLIYVSQLLISRAAAVEEFPRQLGVVVREQ